MTTLGELKLIKAQYEDKVKAEGKRILTDAFKDLFDKHPEVKAIGWNQYTPYFNDGSPCEFSVHKFNFTTVGDWDNRGDDIDVDLYGDAWSEAYGDGPVVEAINNLERDIPEDLMREAFGDHVQVTATRSGFHVTEYDHD